VQRAVLCGSGKGKEEEIQVVLDDGWVAEGEFSCCNDGAVDFKVVGNLEAHAVDRACPVE
jgi:hypothetical protein